MDFIPLSQTIFFVFLLVTFSMALAGRRTARRRGEDDLAGRTLNRWFVGLSAGATANSGFIVTGAVGLGYSTGMQWMMLPLAWLLGDLIFWRWFPQRINAFGHQSGTITLAEILRYGLSPAWAATVSLLSAAIIVLGLGGYTAAQWLAGQKFLSGAFGFSPQTALVMFALLIIAYSSLGGFRGSIYVDTFQAALRLLGTTLVLGTALWLAAADWPTFIHNIGALDTGFLSPFPGAIPTTIGFIGGWAAAALGFGLGQPQIVSRYLASSSPAETRAAQWIYLGYVQFTWLSMTLFGIILRGIMPGLGDPETGLSVFVQTHLFAAVTGVITADVFGVIASTANSLLIVIAQSIKHDFLGSFLPKAARQWSLERLTLLVGFLTMMPLLWQGINESVASLALSCLSIVGAGLAVPVMIKIMGWRHTGASLTGAMVVGIASAGGWIKLGSPYINEAAVGMGLGAAIHYIFLKKGPSRTGNDVENRP